MYRNVRLLFCLDFGLSFHCFLVYEDRLIPIVPLEINSHDKLLELLQKIDEDQDFAGLFD